MKRTFTAGLTLLGVVALILYPAAAFGEELDIAVCAPEPPNTFTLEIDNAFFPMPVGREWAYTGIDEDDGPKGLRITVPGATKTVFSGSRTLTTLVLEEVEWADSNSDGVKDGNEDLIEISQNYFAQNEQDGTVCYFGEAVDIYENGVVVSHDGSWIAGKRRAQAGIFMPATPAVGMTFRQESAPKVAGDEATIIAVDEKIKVPADTYRDTITVSELNTLDGDVGEKAYASGVGLIVDGALELLSFSG